MTIGDIQRCGRSTATRDPRRRGVYFLANDRVADLAIAFLKSFRTHNRTMPLCLIPYDADTRDLERLADAYQFAILPNDRLLTRCDAISKQFHRRVYGQYRKLAAWDGVFDDFIYIDVDTIVLHDLAFSFALLDSYDIITSHSNILSTRKWVWRDSIKTSGALSQDQIDYAANTGYIASRRSVISVDYAERRLADALPLSPHMELLCAEQPLLNYLIVTSGRSYSSLREISRKSKRCDIPLEIWADTPGWEVSSHGQVVHPRPNPPLLVHWAGEWQRDEHLRHPLWRYYRDLEGA